MTENQEKAYIISVDLGNAECADATVYVFTKTNFEEKDPKGYDQDILWEMETP